MIRILLVSEYILNDGLMSFLLNYKTFPTLTGLNGETSKFGVQKSVSIMSICVVLKRTFYIVVHLKRKLYYPLFQKSFKN